ncbi:hypothetical protein ACRQD2_09530 [Actinotignum sp. GS-2025e]|uniref:hypothetical protein n=1 Tax=Actinotignum TaxID=1653174 RepID=UPI00254E86A3|nr:hypothetical protein [Actinotignum timonense]MDK6907086.1 hypothetical protein [Actinotignum timonense]MDK8534672.1 hypothetical protein [Gleimia europaea]MDY5137855.1 hypothetical protein [Actinotignum timonense]
MMTKPNRKTIEVTFEEISSDLAALINASSSPREFLHLCASLVNEIVPRPEIVNLIITGNFIFSTQKRLDDTPVAKSFNLSRGEGIVGGKTLRLGEESYAILLHASLFELSLDYEANADITISFLKILAHESNHVSMHQRGESSVFLEGRNSKLASLYSVANAIIDEYRAELGALQQIPIEAPEWHPDQISCWLEKALIDVVIKYQQHLDVDRLVLDVGSQVSIALKQLAYCVAYENESGKNTPIHLDDLRYENTQVHFGHWFESFRHTLTSLPPGDSSFSRQDALKTIETLSKVLDDYLRIVGFDWDEPMFTIKKDFLAFLRLFCYRRQ